MKQKWTKQAAYAVYIITVAAALFAAGVWVKKQTVQQGIAEKIVRFHVLAASDNADDQQLKLKVRDAVGAYMAKKLAGVEDKAGSEQVILANLEEIKAVAEQAVKEAGGTDTVTASLSVVDFPQKSYGPYVFPAGKYEALEVVIGAGEGHNWWCVMYPNLCFSGSVYETVDEEAGECLREVLSREEYEEVFSSDELQIEWKSLSFLEKICGAR